MPSLPNTDPRAGKMAQWLGEHPHSSSQPLLTPVSEDTMLACNVQIDTQTFIQAKHPCTYNK